MELLDMHEQGNPDNVSSSQDLGSAYNSRQSEKLNRRPAQMHGINASVVSSEISMKQNNLDYMLSPTSKKSDKDDSPTNFLHQRSGDGEGKGNTMFRTYSEENNSFLYDDLDSPEILRAGSDDVDSMSDKPLKESSESSQEIPTYLQ